MVFEYDPATRNYHNKPMYGMMTDGHIYILSHDVNRLEQKQDEDDTYTPTIGETYYINEEAKPRPAKMITNIDDILQVIRNMPEPEDPKSNES